MDSATPKNSISLPAVVSGSDGNKRRIRIGRVPAGEARCHSPHRNYVSNLLFAKSGGLRAGTPRLRDVVKSSDQQSEGARANSCVRGSMHEGAKGAGKLSPEEREHMATVRQRGFSLLEMIAVISIAMVMMAITFLTLQPALKDARVNTAYNSVLGQMRQARQRAVDNREQFIVCFGTDTPKGAATPLGTPTTQTVSTFEWPSGTALSSATEISAIALPSDITFQTLSTPSPGIPTGSTTVPDGFGAGSVALDFDQAVSSGTKDQILFMPDGSARDTTGNLNSGVLYMARTGDLYSSRAITVFGASGRIRGWRLVIKSTTPTWIQQ